MLTIGVITFFIGMAFFNSEGRSNALLGMLIQIVGAYLIFKGREKLGLKNKSR